MTYTNEQLALQIIYSSTSTTRSDLIKQLGLSQATVMRLVNDLIEQNYITENDPSPSNNTRGRPSSILRINPEYGVVVGVELGRDTLVISFISADGTLLNTVEPTNVPEFLPTIETIDNLIKIIFRELNLLNLPSKNIIAVGLAVHDLVSSNGEWVTWQQVFDDPFPVQEYLTSKLNIPVKVDDISRAFALAEHRFGGGRNQADMIYLFVGRRGVGSGIFVNNQVLKSTLGICGEIGHVIVENNGELCQCGNHGCLETVATYEAIISRVQNRIDAGVVSSLSNIDNLTFSDICHAYTQGDKEANIALSQLSIDLSNALTSTISILGSTHILIGGDLRNAGPAFLDDIERVLRMQLIPGLAHRISVCYAELPNYAGSWGAATFALDDLWINSEFLKTVV